MLCSACLGVLVDGKGFLRKIETAQPRASVDFIHHQAGSDLRASAWDGCLICYAIWNAQPNMPGYQDMLQIQPKGVTEMTLFYPNEEAQRPNVSTEDVHVTVFAKAIDLDLAKSSFVLKPSASEMSFGFEVSSSDMSTWNPSIDLAKDWISSCVNGHERCASMKTSEDWYPTRLLDVASPDLPPLFVRLIVSGEDSPKGAYATLSHCWGQSRPLELTRHSLQDFRQRFHIHAMPQTFQDAILVCRRLGVRYLWIDSLCIMQDKDDLSDWSREASRMHQVYSNGHVNLSATGAPDSSCGLFAARDELILQKQEVDLQAGGHLPQRFVRKCILIDRAIWNRNVASAPLLRRAWVLQERFLSARVLHFCQDQLYWECCELSASEMYPKRMPAETGQSEGWKASFLDPSRLVESATQAGAVFDTSNAREPAYLLWNSLADLYCSCQLTHGSDRLIALSGLAKRMAEPTQDEYIAGMWRNRLGEDLLWYVKDCIQVNGDVSRRPDKYRAPSFSWASVDGCIANSFLGPRPSKLLWSVDDAVIEPVSYDLTGAIKGGHIQVSGCLKPFKMYSRLVEGEKCWLMRDGESDLLLSGEFPTRMIFLDVDRDDFENCNARGSLYYVPARINTAAYTEEPVHNYLLLEHDHAAEYQRVGLCVVQDVESNEAMIATRDDENGVPCFAYDDVKHIHTFRII